MSRNQALEKVGRARVAYFLQQRGWLVGEAFDNGYDLLAFNTETKDICLIELKTMDLNNRGAETNLTSPVSKKERESCTHIIVYLEPEGRCFIARKEKILTKKGNIFAATTIEGKLRKPRKGSYSFAVYENCWEELKSK
ncbi:hypothetical protein [Ulvibacterium marinum]|uniref:Uncharacterized protein n=1 Tax=Ulvibacterium marinum TaxID=2419782 RepID=A0A3B0C4G9_9FLAO|nr:hypothetical protein [Ulvibacterium marinum]RKN81045.1 hypothetical protein D7Z94_08830 [Ulvibacterium marinum]